MPGRAISIATSSSATMPANALRRPAISRMAGMGATLGMMTGGETLCAEPADKSGGEAAHAAPRIERQQHHKDAEDHQPQLLGDPQPLRQPDGYDRADQWPEQIPRAAQDHAHDH